MLDLSSLKRAIELLDDSLRFFNDSEIMDGLDLSRRNVVRSGVIQNFEVAYELCWKFMKKHLEINLGSEYVDGISRKELFRISREHHLINDVENWFDFHTARNLTSHTYSEESAQKVLRAAGILVEDAKALLNSIEARND